MQSCVHIYSQMGLYEEAVNLSLKVCGSGRMLSHALVMNHSPFASQYHDLELARINADKPEDDDVLRKRLWLNIAKHVVQEKKDIKTYVFDKSSIPKQSEKCDFVTVMVYWQCYGVPQAKRSFED